MIQQLVAGLHRPPIYPLPGLISSEVCRPIVVEVHFLGESGAAQKQHRHQSFHTHCSCITVSTWFPNRSKRVTSCPYCPSRHLSRQMPTLRRFVTSSCMWLLCQKSQALQYFPVRGCRRSAARTHGTTNASNGSPANADNLRDRKSSFTPRESALSPGLRAQLSVRSYPDSRRRELLRLLAKRIGAGPVVVRSRR